MSTEQVRQDVRDMNVIFVHSNVDDAGLTAAEFRVYGHLARRAGHDGAYPGIDSMARVCRLNRDTVIESIKTLETKRMIRVIKATGKTNTYVLTRRSEWSEIGNGDPSEIRNAPVGNKERTSRKSGTKGNPTKVIQLRDLPEQLQSEPFLVVWQEWEGHRKQKRAKLTDAAIKRQLATLSAMGQERAIAALNHSMEKGYTGIFEHNDTDKRPTAGGSNRTTGTANAAVTAAGPSDRAPVRGVQVFGRRPSGDGDGSDGVRAGHD